jgi:endoglucanase
MAPARVVAMWGFRVKWVVRGSVRYRGIPLMCCMALACAFLPAPASAQLADPRGVDPASPNPLVGLSFYVEHWSHPAWRQYVSYRRHHKRWSAAMIWKIAREPKFHWFGRFSKMAWVRYYLAQAARRQPGSVPLITVMRHQGRRCGGGYAGGGPREDARTRKWYRRFAHTVGARRVVIAFEPDSLGTVDCLAPRWRRNRLDLLRYGVDVLSQLPNATIYLEGGASDWEPSRRTAKQLRYIGIAKVRGFMLNATHYDWTLANIRHGLEISALTGGKPFIVNTSSNGRGPVHYRRWRGPHKWRRINVWCHPRRRGLGIPPTTVTDDPKVDAYMWIGRPGFSGGACNGGPLPVGTWWPERALGLAKYQTDWVRPPRGTRYGLYRRYTPRQLGAGPAKSR